MQINFSCSLFEWQKDLIDQIDNNLGKIHCVLSKRQCAKTHTMMVYSLKYALEHKSAYIYFLSVTFRNCDKVYKELLPSIEKAPFIKRTDNQKLRIEFVNGSFIQFISAEQSEASLQGNSAHLVLVDEASYLPEPIWNAVLPYTNVTKGTIICCSTPRFKQDWFAKLYFDGLNENNKAVMSFSFNKYDTSCMLSQDMLEYYKKSLPLNKFKNYYLGEFVDGNGDVFQDFSKCIGKPTDDDFKDTVVIGVDWSGGTGNDDTVFTAITVNNVVLEQLAFNDKESLETIQELMAFADKYNTKKIVVESNGLGKILYDLIKDEVKKKGRYWVVESFTTTNDSKLNQVEYLQVLFQNDDIVLPDDDNLVNQLGAYERTISPSGKQVFNAPQGTHDDRVISLMLATWAVKKNKKKTTFL